MTHRLPTPGSDDGAWGAVLNDYLSQSLNSDGTLKTSAVSAAAPVTAVAGKTGAVILTKSDINLTNVDNTSDTAKPVSAATQTALNTKANTADLATVATSGSYSDLTNKPVAVSQVNSDWSAVTGSAQILNKPVLSTVATSGSYTDLSNKPTIPVVTDATSSAKGIVQLSGDLGGLAANPTVAKVNGVAISGTPNPGQAIVATNSTSAAWSTVTGTQGATGPTGMVWRGVYSNTTTYGTNDAVSYNGSSYITTAGTTGVNPGTPSSPTSPWTLLAQIGATGIAGPAGAAAGGNTNPTDQSLIAWTYDPLLIAANQSPATGVVQLARLTVSSATTITNIISYVGSVTSVSLTSGQNFAALYNASGTLLSSTADQSTAWTTVGVKTMALSAPQAVNAGYYYVALLINGTTAPQFGRSSSAAPTAVVNFGPAASSPRQATSGSSQTAPPSSINLGIALTSNIVPWMAIT